MLLEIFLYKYYKYNDNYTQNLKHLKIFEYKAYIYILKKKLVKFYRYIGKIKKDILIGYKNINIFQIYFLLKKKIK